MMWGWDMGWGGWLLMSLTTVGLWVLVAVSIFAVLRATRDIGGSSRRGSEDEAERILRERFARGEISAEEYRTSQDVLQAGR